MHAQIEAAAAEAVQGVGGEECRAVAIVVLSAPPTLRHDMVKLIGPVILHHAAAPSFGTSKSPGRWPLAQAPFGRAACRTSSSRRNASADQSTVQLPTDALPGGTERVGQTSAGVVVVLGHVGRSGRWLLLRMHRKLILWHVCPIRTVLHVVANMFLGPEKILDLREKAYFMFVQQNYDFHNPYR